MASLLKPKEWMLKSRQAPHVGRSLKHLKGFPEGEKIRELKLDCEMSQFTASKSYIAINLKSLSQKFQLDLLFYL